jgi:hypothetical protein
MAGVYEDEYDVSSGFSAFQTIKFITLRGERYHMLGVLWERQRSRHRANLDNLTFNPILAEM